MPGAVHVDDVDRALLALLRADGRLPVAELARRVGLSPAPVGRRVERLERAGVISGYTAVIDETLLGGSLEALVELRVAGRAGVGEVLARLRRLDAVVEVLTLAGDPDAVARLRVSGPDQLRTTIAALRREADVASTRTLLVIDSWRREQVPPPSRLAAQSPATP
ncbi:Lrp/AsnC family transcriptional regulator [Conexibacter sp. JD483]|uniref:Lrp/AsnC family transcriptional regulator n=1 Tax=unclassified Conexibacter TaxID=2627773 RepID=UPI002727C2D0|nr:MULTISPECIES: Lrp/AsnC family transcriptional regulator [unclassified Conexibacter]MDO8187570.1 Lrp/AsnC family transcriptional regulator [Conexibacter sp. CPCC 205706]MDO8198936.1 Lrp/AsnC family transcriptional regulator [Conexibacter sp. CPCC 205762]MDR9370357.1 Lrp/AsnC family transcriptional regulator [Conexibacter sp. JD483]